MHTYHSNKPTFESVVNENDLSRKHENITSIHNEALLNDHETVNDHTDEFTANGLLFKDIGLLNYGKK